MNSDWTTQRGQLDQALDRERALRQARRRQQPSLWQTLGQRLMAARLWVAKPRWVSARPVLGAIPPQL
jgi:hypothetical protein